MFFCWISPAEFLGFMMLMDDSIHRAKFVINIFPASTGAFRILGINSITASMETLLESSRWLYPFLQHEEFCIISCRLQVHVSWSYVAADDWKHIHTYTTLVFSFCAWLMNEGYTSVPTHHVISKLCSYKLPQLSAGECRWQCVRRGDELCQVFLPSGDVS